MRTAYLKETIAIVFISFLLLNCQKGNEKFQIDGVTDFTWKVYTVQITSDNYTNPIPADWELNLNSDRHFSFRLGSSVCGGTYSWTSIDTASAHVKFTINEWSNPLQSSGIADKLREIIQSVDKCYSYKFPFLGQYPGPPSGATTVLQLQGSQGFFYVYR